jgi:phosphate transport system ATP-binding protein
MNHSNGTATALASRTIVQVEGLTAHYGDKKALSAVHLSVPENGVTTFIGPSGCGKSTLLRSLNRMNDRIAGFRHSGRVLVDGDDIYGRGVDLLELRRKVGMVFQKPNPFPKSIYENVAIGPRAHYGLRGPRLDEVVEQALTDAGLWNEVKDHLHSSGLGLSGGQQQRLCIARMLAVQPKVLLMDEPCSALDPISTAHIEGLIVELAKNRTVLVVTHNLQQAERISDHTAFFMFGEIVESGPSSRLFTSPEQKATQDYVSGRFG